MPSFDEITRAYDVLRDVAEVTPLQRSRFLEELVGGEVWLKCENLQRTGSFKVRGAGYRMSKLSPSERERGVVTASAGNHAQGVAFAAASMGIHATIFMPEGVPLPKLQATRGYGAEVVLRGSNVGEALAAAHDHAAATGAVLVHPYDHEDVVAGQATLALDIARELADLEQIIVPIGGGGLIAGVIAGLRQHPGLKGRPVRIVGVQAENSSPFQASLDAGHPVHVPSRPTIADGIAVAEPGRVPFDIIRDELDELITVSDDDIARALITLLERGKLVVEPAGAVGVAAILRGKVQAPREGAGKTVVLLSGGNIDPLMMERVIARGLVASDRYLSLSIMMPDRPGQLARISRLLADANANVIEATHARLQREVQIQNVELQISVETRGPEHCALVIEELRRAGYDPVRIGASQSAPAAAPDAVGE